MELWDVYDARRQLTGRTHRRGVPMQPGDYHLIVFVWIFNSAGQLLLTKRSPEKESYPNLWETTGGAVIAGETSREAIVRELREETGLSAERMTCLTTLLTTPGFCTEKIAVYLAQGRAAFQNCFSAGGNLRREVGEPHSL